MTQKDGELVRGCIRGDDKAFSRLVERHQTVACAIAYNIIGDFGLAEDVAQSAFLAAYNTLGKLREPEKFASWFRGIVSHLALDQIRRLKQRPIPFEAIQEQPAASADSSTQDDAQAALRLSIRALGELPREAVTLKFFSGLSYKEIGEVMGVPASTVRGYLARGMAELRNRMDSTRGHEEGESE